MNLLDIVIVNIEPQDKDYKRATQMDFYKSGMRNWFYGNGSPIQSLAEKQAKLIKDPVKLVRRAKAVAAVWGTRDYIGCGGGQEKIENPWTPFERALHSMGFNRDQIGQVAKFHKEHEFIQKFR
jgi:hypothetical protein